MSPSSCQDIEAAGGARRRRLLQEKGGAPLAGLGRHLLHAIEQGTGASTVQGLVESMYHRAALGIDPVAGFILAGQFEGTLQQPGQRRSGALLRERPETALDQDALGMF